MTRVGWVVKWCTSHTTPTSPTSGTSCSKTTNRVLSMKILRMMEEETIRTAVGGQPTASQHRIQHRHNQPSTNIKTADMSGQTTADTPPTAARHFHNSTRVTTQQQQQQPTHHNTTAAWQRVSLSWSEASLESSLCLCRLWLELETRLRGAGGLQRVDRPLA